MRKLFRWLFIAVGVFSTLFVVVGIIAVTTSDKPSKSQPPAAAVSGPSAAPAIEEVAVFETTALALEQLFAANEVKALQTIKGKVIRVAGRVQAIEKDFMGTTVVSLATSNPFLPARLSLGKADESKAAELVKGVQLKVVCGGAHYTVGMVTGEDCKLP